MADGDVARMIVGARHHRVSWVPHEPSAVLSLLPEGTRAHPDRHVFAVQYVVDSAAQTSGLDAHSAALVGVELDIAGPDGPMHAGLVTHVVASTPAAQRFYAGLGCHVTAGRTTVSVRQGVVTAETRCDDVTVLHAGSRVGAPTVYETAHHDHVVTPGGRPVVVTLPWIATVADPWVPLVVDMPDPSHPAAPLQPGRDPQIVDGSYSPNAAWCWPQIIVAGEAAHRVPSYPAPFSS